MSAAYCELAATLAACCYLGCLLLPWVRCILMLQGFPNSGVDLVSTSSVEPGEACRCKVTATVSGVTTQINAEKNSQRDYALAA